MLDQLDLNEINIGHETYVEDNLKKQISYLLYSVRTKNNKKAFIYVLLEHQSSCDYWIAFRLWKYLLLLCDKHKDEKKNKFPLVIPIVLYNGKTKYIAPMNLWELFDNPKLSKQVLTNDYQLVDLQSISDSEIKKNPHLGMVEFMMKHIHEKNQLNVLREMLVEFKKSIQLDRKNIHIYLRSIL